MSFKQLVGISSMCAAKSLREILFDRRPSRDEESCGGVRLKYLLHNARYYTAGWKRNRAGYPYSPSWSGLLVEFFTNFPGSFATGCENLNIIEGRLVRWQKRHEIFLVAIFNLIYPEKRHYRLPMLLDASMNTINLEYLLNKYTLWFEFSISYVERYMFTLRRVNVLEYGWPVSLYQYLWDYWGIED